MATFEEEAKAIADALRALTSGSDGTLRPISSLTQITPAQQATLNTMRSQTEALIEVADAVEMDPLVLAGLQAMLTGIAGLLTLPVTDTFPDAFSFASVADAAASSVHISDAITVSGINAPATISIVSGEYRINGGEWTSADGTVSVGALVEVRGTASSAYETAVIVALTIGGRSATFTITTGVEPPDTVPDAFSFTSVFDAELSTVYESNEIEVAGINTASPITVTGGEYSKNGSAYTSTAGEVVEGDTVTVRHTSSASHETATTTTLTIGGVAASFTTTTAEEVPEPDTTPVAFSLGADVADATPSTTHDRSFTVSGINVATAISVIGAAEYKIGSGSYTTADLTVANGDVVTVRLTASASYETAVSGGVDVGGVSDTFSVTTIEDPADQVVLFDDDSTRPIAFRVGQTVTEAGHTWGKFSYRSLLMHGVGNYSTHDPLDGYATADPHSSTGGGRWWTRRDDQTAVLNILDDYVRNTGYSFVRRGGGKTTLLAQHKANTAANDLTVTAGDGGARDLTDFFGACLTTHSSLIVVPPYDFYIYGVEYPDTGEQSWWAALGWQRQGDDHQSLTDPTQRATWSDTPPYSHTEHDPGEKTGLASILDELFFNNIYDNGSGLTGFQGDHEDVGVDVRTKVWDFWQHTTETFTAYYYREHGSVDWILAHSTEGVEYPAESRFADAPRVFQFDLKGGYRWSDKSADWVGNVTGSTTDFETSFKRWRVTTPASNVANCTNNTIDPATLPDMVISWAVQPGAIDNAAPAGTVLATVSNATGYTLEVKGVSGMGFVGNELQITGAIPGGTHDITIWAVRDSDDLLLQLVDGALSITVADNLEWWDPTAKVALNFETDEVRLSGVAGTWGDYVDSSGNPTTLLRNMLPGWAATGVAVWKGADGPAQFCGLYGYSEPQSRGQFAVQYSGATPAIIVKDGNGIDQSSPLAGAGSAFAAAVSWAAAGVKVCSNGGTVDGSAGAFLTASASSPRLWNSGFGDAPFTGTKQRLFLYDPEDVGGSAGALLDDADLSALATPVSATPTIYAHDLFSIDAPANGTNIDNRVASIIPGDDVGALWDRISNGSLTFLDGAVEGFSAGVTSTAIYLQLAGERGATASGRFKATNANPAWGLQRLTVASSADFANAYWFQVTTDASVQLWRRVGGSTGQVMIASWNDNEAETDVENVYSLSWEPLAGPNRVRLRIYKNGSLRWSHEDTDDLQIRTPGYAGIQVTTHSQCSEFWLSDANTPGLELLVYPPTFTSPLSAEFPESEAYVHHLTADEPCTFEIVGGPDVDDFVISEVAGWYDIAIVATEFDFEDPYDADVNNVYSIDIRATSIATGLSTTETHTFTVTDVEPEEPDTPTLYFHDDFASSAPAAGADIESRAASVVAGAGAWDRTSAGLFYYGAGYFRGVNGQSPSTAIYTQLPGSNGACVSARMRSTDPNVLNGVFRLVIAATAGYGDAYWVRFSTDSTIELYRRIAGANGTPIATWTSNTPSLNVPAVYSLSWQVLSDRVRLRIYKDGALLETYDDTSPSRITTPGYGGFQTTAHSNCFACWMADAEVTLVTPAEPTPAELPYLGVYVGGTTTDVAPFEAWVGRSVQSVPAHGNRGSSSKTADQQWLEDWRGAIGFICRSDRYLSLGKFITFSIPLLTATGTTLAQAAAGAYNSHYTYAAQRIAAAYAGQSVLYIRTGEEFNATWFPWKPHGGNEQNFINAFRQFVNCFRAVDPRFKFEWNTYVGRWTTNGVNLDPEVCYPGDQYVDVIGMDVYWNPQHTIPNMEVGYDTPNVSEAITFLRTRNGRGMDWLVTFARAHNKPIAISEWGLECDKIQTQDLTPFFRFFADYFVQNDVLYANYWNVNSGGANGDLTDTFTQFRDEFRAAFNPA